MGQPARLSDRRPNLIVLLRNAVGEHRLLHEEGVVRISRRVRLGLEQSVEVPERALNPFVRWHLLEAHFHQNTSELGSHLWRLSV
jgi:hypothetical protein